MMDLAGSLSKVERAQRPHDIQQEMSHLSTRDWQLWSIGALLMLVLAAGVLAVVLPNATWTQKSYVLEQRYLPQLLLGLITLVILVNLYLVSQRKVLNSTRAALVRELIYNQRLENMSLFDPLTQLLNRRALDELLVREVTRVNRAGDELTFLLMDLDDFRVTNSNFGHQAGDELLIDAARLLKANFRGADLIFRYGGDEFLVVMPETSLEQAEVAVRRLLRSAENWNLANKRGFQMGFNWGLAAYAAGADVTEVLRQADRKLYQRKHNMVPLF